MLRVKSDDSGPAETITTRGEDDWITERAREMAAEALDNRTAPARDWLYDAMEGNGTEAAMLATRDVIEMAIADQFTTDKAELAAALDRLRELYMDENADEYESDALAELEQDDGDDE